MTLGKFCILVWAAVVLMGAAALSLAAAPAAPTAKAAPEPVTISVALEHPDKPAYVGEPLALRVAIKNNTGKPLMVPDWTHFESELMAHVDVTEYPGGGDKKPATVYGSSWNPSGTMMKSDYMELPPGETVVSRTVTPMLPGKADIVVILDGPTQTWVSGTDGVERKWENGWTGKATGSLPLTLPAEMSPEMNKRYEEARRQLDDPIIPSDQKGRLLAAIGEEKHYFAARFIRDFTEKQPPGPTRDGAIWQLLKLARVGTAYESIPLLLGWMTDEGTNQEFRVAIMDWAVERLTESVQRPFTYIGFQAWYYWPETLQKQAREALQKLTKDSNPYLAAHAEDAIRKLPAPDKK
jgi:hypothetical protein